jgi:hypothetical protein
MSAVLLLSGKTAAFRFSTLRAHQIEQSIVIHYSLAAARAERASLAYLVHRPVTGRPSLLNIFILFLY